MGLRDKFNQLLSGRKNQAASESVKDGFSELAPPAEMTYDDLASVPFAGDQPNTTKLNQPNLAETQPVEEMSSINRIIRDIHFYDNIPDDKPLGPDFVTTKDTSPEAKKFRDFLQLDLKIKQELIDLAPKNTDRISESAQIDYADRAYQSLRDFKFDFLQITRAMGYGETGEKAINAFFEREQQHFMIGSYDAETPQKLYRDAFANMRSSFVEKVKDASSGYTLFKNHNLNSLTRDAETINELLHAYHSCIMNSEHNLQSVPVIEQKQSREGYPISFRGDRTETAQHIFDEIPEDLSIGRTEIVSIDENVMMMVRDRGHALMIDAEPDEQDPQTMWVRYHIPKICNVGMIKALPGFNHLSINGANGGFSVSKNKVGTAIADFISRVPMDHDIDEETREYYNEHRDEEGAK